MGRRVKEGTGALTVYHMVAYQRLPTLPLPPHPNSLAFDTAGAQLFVSVKNDENNKKAKEAESVVPVQ